MRNQGGGGAARRRLRAGGSMGAEERRANDGERCLRIPGAHGVSPRNSCRFSMRAMPKLYVGLLLPSLAFAIKVQKLTAGDQYDERGGMWSPDGKEIAYISNHIAEPDRNITMQLFVVATSGEAQPQRLTQLRGRERRPAGVGPGWEG